MKKYQLVIGISAFALLLGGAFMSTAAAKKMKSCNVRTDNKFVDGCSGPWLPNLHTKGINIDFKKLFKSACNKHDRSYHTIGCSKGESDDTFKVDMIRACDRNFPYKPITVLGKNIGDKNGVQRAACGSAAETFYQAVNIGGGSSYDNAQERGDN